MISFESDATLSNIEDAYVRLALADGSLLRMPIALRLGGSFAVPVSLIQFVAAWSRQTDMPTLRSYGGSGNAAMLELAQSPHGFASIYFAQRLNDGLGDSVSRPATLEAAVGRIEAMQEMRFRATMAGRGVFLACAAGARNEFLVPLYSKPNAGGTRGRRDFRSLTERIIDACAPTMLRRMSDADLSSIASLLYELFKNTDDHALEDSQGAKYDWHHPSLRGIVAKYISTVKDGQDVALARENPPLALFLTKSQVRKSRATQDEKDLRVKTSNSFLELTIFDTGPGMARRWAAQRESATSSIDMDIEDEVRFVLKCFELHATTKDDESKGIGLDSVVDALWRLGAFLRLRTGRICLYQDFSVQSKPAFRPNHWQKDRREFAPTAGTSYSILIPLSQARR